MQYTTLGKTGLKVSVAGLGCGGFSRLGLRAGKTQDECARLVCEAVDLGINVIDTAPVYGTEAIVGKALKSIPRDKVVVATKAVVYRNNIWHTPEMLNESVEKSLRLLGTDHVDLLQLHSVFPAEYGYARDVIGPALRKLKEQGKIRHIGITEQPTDDFTHETLQIALADDDLWEVFLAAFHMMHQSARKTLFPLAQRKRIGVLLMYAVRSIFADPARVAAAMRQAAAKGQVEPWLGEAENPLAFLLHDGGARSITEAAYRFARHEPGVDVVLFGTGDSAHLRANVASLLAPPLPQPDRDRLAALFGHLTGIGMDATPPDAKK